MLELKTTVVYFRLSALVSNLKRCIWTTLFFVTGAVVVVGLAIGLEGLRLPTLTTIATTATAILWFGA
jgi:hydrogenase/urease accessory protein HupE